MTICSSRGYKTKRLREERLMPDIFQGVYFGSVGSQFRGKEIFQIRRELGLELVDLYKTSRADVVIPNLESGWGVTVGIAEGLKNNLFPALIKLPQAVRTFQEGERATRSKEVGLKFGGVESLLRNKNAAMGNDSIVRGSVSEGGSVWVAYNAGATYIEFWVSFGGRPVCPVSAVSVFFPWTLLLIRSGATLYLLLSHLDSFLSHSDIFTLQPHPCLVLSYANTPCFFHLTPL